jgi:hypothetical protein
MAQYMTFFEQMVKKVKETKIVNFVSFSCKIRKKHFSFMAVDMFGK